MPKIELKCGKRTCYNPDTNEWCVMARVARFGTLFECAYFNKELIDADGVRSGPNWLQRLPECLKLATD